MRKRNPSVVYSGAPGKIRPARYRSKAKTPSKGFKHYCVAGPMAGKYLTLHDTSNTLTFTYRGQTGHYISGVWIPR